jgi:hypothetical protein
MKVCTKCYTENSDDQVFCSGCGMTFMGAPASEEAVKLKELSAGPEPVSRPHSGQPSSMFGIWLPAITRPVLATYEELLKEEPNPTLSKALGWIAIAGVIAGAVGGLLNLLFGMARGESLGTLLAPWLKTLVATPVGALISFVILSAIWLVIARAFGGQGNLGSQSYLLAAAEAPVSIISGCLATIPGVGSVIAWLASIYVVYLTVLALRAAHRFGWGKAVATLLIPIVVLSVGWTCILLTVGPSLSESFG